MTTMLVASGGGHLQQLASLVPRFGWTDEEKVIWATPKSGLSDHILHGQEHFELPYTMPRDWRGALKLTRIAARILRQSAARRIISTGASPAPPFFLAGASMGLELHYIESATRCAGPSLSGRLVSMVPSANLYTQYPHCVEGRWRFAGSIFDPYAPGDVPPPGSAIQRVVVTLGTEGYGFRRAVERLLQVLPREATVLWQTGSTDVEGLGIEARRAVPGDELRRAIAAADVVVSHAGTGSAITAFETGKVPLLLPREARHREHVDDHQMLTANELTRRGLAVSVQVNSLTLQHLERTRTFRVIRDEMARPFELVGRKRATHSAVVDLRDIARGRRRTVGNGHELDHMRSPGRVGRTRSSIS